MAHGEHRVLEPQEILFLIALDQHNRGPNKPDGTPGEIREGLDPMKYATIKGTMKPFDCNEVMLLEQGYCIRPAPDRTGRLVQRAFAITAEGRAAIPRFLRQALEKARTETQAAPHAPAREIADKLVKRLEDWMKVYQPPEHLPAPTPLDENEEESEETSEETYVPTPRRSSTATVRRAPESVRASRRPPTVAEVAKKGGKPSPQRRQPPSKAPGERQERTVQER